MDDRSNWLANVFEVNTTIEPTTGNRRHIDCHLVRLQVAHCPCAARWQTNVSLAASIIPSRIRQIVCARARTSHGLVLHFRLPFQCDDKALALPVMGWMLHSHRVAFVIIV